MSDDLMQRMEGCFYTIFTPFKVDYSVDYEAIEKYLTTLYRQGARKFYAMAYNSRYSQLTHPEILQLNEFCIKTVKKLELTEHCHCRRPYPLLDCGIDRVRAAMPARPGPT